MSGLDARLDLLDETLRGYGSVLVAFSGGADSAFLLAAAARSLGPDSVAAGTALSPSLPLPERESARSFAAGLGVRHVEVETRELNRPGYQANGRDRCFHCKAELLDVLTPLAAQLGLAAVATGTNADDAIDPFRPGIAAAAARGACIPLREAGLTKAEVREASRRWGLDTADKPAAACLASRVAYGIPVTSARLARIERAEASVRTACRTAGLPLRNLRVRDLGGVARVEVDQELVDQLLTRPALTAAIDGFDRVEVDPRGFRSGSLNEPESA